VSNEIVHVVDLLPTLGTLAGYDVPDDRIIDGVDQLDFFLGEQEKSNREAQLENAPDRAREHEQ
jgi:arylsulfatase